MGNNLKSACDGILQRTATGKDRVPGVVAMVTDRSANVYEGAAGERILGASQAMTTDTVALHRRLKQPKTRKPSTQRTGGTRNMEDRVFDGGPKE